jgi:hypothetical protein
MRIKCDKDNLDGQDTLSSVKVGNEHSLTTHGTHMIEILFFFVDHSNSFTFFCHMHVFCGYCCICLLSRNVYAIIQYYLKNFWYDMLVQLLDYRFFSFSKKKKYIQNVSGAEAWKNQHESSVNSTKFLHCEWNFNEFLWLLCRQCKFKSCPTH